MVISFPVNLYALYKINVYVQLSDGSRSINTSQSVSRTFNAFTSPGFTSYHMPINYEYIEL